MSKWLTFNSKLCTIQGKLTKGEAIMKREEMETTIVIDMTDKATVYTNMKSWVSELKEYTKRYEDCVLKNVQKDSNGNITGYFFEVPSDCIRLKKRRD